MSLYGVDLSISIKRIHNDLKLHFANKGGITLKNLKNIFNQFDVNRNHKIDITEFEKGLNYFSFFPK